MSDVDDMSGGETAISYANEFLAAGVEALDETFGEGYAKANPQALAGYLAACASNLNAFMAAASVLPGPSLLDALTAFEQNEKAPPHPPAKPKRGR